MKHTSRSVSKELLRNSAFHAAIPKERTEYEQACSEAEQACFALLKSMILELSCRNLAKKGEIGPSSQKSG